jgi:DNA replication protein DnaD
MPASMFSYTKNVLENVSFDPTLFSKEVEKAIKMLLPYELEQLITWLYSFTTARPELKGCLAHVAE